MSTSVILFVAFCVVAVLALFAYLAASAGAGRWLTASEWWGRSTCAHTHGRLLSIGFDGESVYECTRCGKHVKKPL